MRTLTASFPSLPYKPGFQEDLLQQVEYGVEGLLASFRVAGHIFAGIIENSQPQYDLTGDPVNITDNHIYDSSLKPDQVEGERSGKPDDRWAFTNRNTGLQYRVAQTFAVASRVLRPKKAALADECLAAARKLWEYEQTNPPVYAPNGAAATSQLAGSIATWWGTGTSRSRCSSMSRCEARSAAMAFIFAVAAVFSSIGGAMCRKKRLYAGHR